jgi:SAM-dependent methyltransferase
VTERDRYRRAGREPVNGWGDKATGRQEPHSDSHDGGYVDVRTLGWRSTCDHDDDSGRATVLDPFAGSGTTEVVALRYDRSFVGIELSADYCEMARNRIRDDAPLLNTQLEAA